MQRTMDGVRAAGAVVHSEPDRLILVFNAESGLRAMLLDVLKKAVGREDCALCEITYGPLGKRGDWKQCERALGLVVDEIHRDQIPPGWNLTHEQLPCVLARVRDATPFILLTREAIASCAGSIDALGRQIRTALDRRADRAA